MLISQTVVIYVSGDKPTASVQLDFQAGRNTSFMSRGEKSKRHSFCIHVRAQETETNKANKRITCAIDRRWVVVICFCVVKSFCENAMQHMLQKIGEGFCKVTVRKDVLISLSYTCYFCQRRGLIYFSCFGFVSLFFFVHEVDQ